MEQIHNFQLLRKQSEEFKNTTEKVNKGRTINYLEGSSKELEEVCAKKERS